MVVVGAKHHLVDVPREHAHLMVSRAQVELCEVAGAMQLVQELVHHRDGELVLGRPRVEGAIVDAKTPGPVQLTNEENWCGERGRARADDALREHAHDLALQLALLQLGVAVQSDGDGSGARQEVDAVVVRLGWWKALLLLEDGGVVLEKPIEHGSLGVGGRDRAVGRGAPMPGAARHTTWRPSHWKTSVHASKSQVMGSNVRSKLTPRMKSKQPRSMPTHVMV
jgi:hypothetical protein